MDNPLSQNPDSTWSQYFRNAELEKMVNQDLSRLYREHESYFHTPGCQGMLRRILLLWCLRHPDCGYRQGMHGLLAPLLYVLHVDVERLLEVRKLYEDLFIDKFDGFSFEENGVAYNFDFKKFADSVEDEIESQGNSKQVMSLYELDPELQAVVLLSDAYGAEGELGIVLSKKFMEHNAYCMFDALMIGAHGSDAYGLGLLNLFLLLLIKAKLLLGSYKLHSLQSKFLFLHPCQVDDGVVLPDEASLYLTAIEDAEYKDDKIEFWNNVYGFDMSCIKKQAMMEPLVDTVDQKQIVTNCHLLKTMDISKMVLGDASFTAPFKLIAERDDYIHAFVAYFDVSFTKCHKLMGFSTGPRSRATHWKQTVLYLEDVLTICEGETIIGSMTVAPNKKNPRDVDIMVKYSLSGRRCVVSRVQFYKMR
ncbi:hypothetical protein ES288_D08G295000v1 [Gossypium darwinii]|uniref:Rab-GAP TBC domain-containing protein n=1 Tax=Gossypium darwinii TaxID=34276 RepID=A0A5D2BT17_GOSDA|nr:hypothetical protein ES288_D08G295000v1 [Gossypium darwinii]